MGLYFRKSFGSGPFRINFSKSGISYSVGVKGARVNFSNRGTYVNFGSNGIYYRKKISGNEPKHEANFHPQPILSPYVQHSITSANIDDLTDADSQEFIHELTEKSNKISYYNWFGIMPIFLVALFVGIIFFGNSTDTATNTTVLYDKQTPLFWVIMIVLSVGSFILLRWLKSVDTARLLIAIHYDIDEGVSEVYNKFINHFAELLSSSKSWQYLHSQQTNDYKYSSGASNSITRRRLTNISTNKPPSKIFRTNVDIPYLGLINTELFFFPERLIVKRQNKFAAITYKNIECSGHITRFIEEEGIPNDTRVVGSTWKYLNKNGTPDKRFKNNRQIPICEYSEYHIGSTSGVNEAIATSKVGVFDQFVRYVTAIGTLQRHLPSTPPTT